MSRGAAGARGDIGWSSMKPPSRIPSASRASPRPRAARVAPRVIGVIGVIGVWTASAGCHRAAKRELSELAAKLRPHAAAVREARYAAIRALEDGALSKAESDRALAAACVTIYRELSQAGVDEAAAQDEAVRKALLGWTDALRTVHAGACVGKVDDLCTGMCSTGIGKLCSVERRARPTARSGDAGQGAPDTAIAAPRGPHPPPRTAERAATQGSACEGVLRIEEMEGPSHPREPT